LLQFTLISGVLVPLLYIYRRFPAPIWKFFELQANFLSKNPPSTLITLSQIAFGLLQNLLDFPTRRPTYQLRPWVSWGMLRFCDPTQSPIISRDRSPAIGHRGHLTDIEKVRYEESDRTL
jgi:hypothetical protein